MTVYTSTPIFSGTPLVPGDPVSSGVASMWDWATALRQEIILGIVEKGLWIKMTGSRVTKDGWTSESDWDYVVYDPDHKYYDSLNKEEWVLGSNVDSGEFTSIRKGDVNLILVDKEDIWKKYIIATNLIKTLNSKTKGERITVFDSVFGRDSNAKAVEF